DADALALLSPPDLERFDPSLVLTPHQGEMKSLAESFELGGTDKVAQACDLAIAARAVVIAKGPDTVIASPDGRTVFAPSPTSWLSTAGTGDVLAGLVASRLSTGAEPFVAACEAAWLHGEAARLTPEPFTATELAHGVARAYAAALGVKPNVSSASPREAMAPPRRGATLRSPRRGTCFTPTGPWSRGRTTPSRRAVTSAAAGGANCSISTKRRSPASCMTA